MKIRSLLFLLLFFLHFSTASVQVPWATKNPNLARISSPLLKQVETVFRSPVVFKEIAVPKGYERVLLAPRGKTASAVKRLSTFLRKNNCVPIDRSLYYSIPAFCPAGTKGDSKIILSKEFNFEKSDEEMNKFIKANIVQDASFLGTGFSGKGVGVAVVDTGIDCSHNLLSGKCFFGADVVEQRTSPTDANGHGTDVALVIAAKDSPSYSKFKGVAPGSSVYSFRVFLQGSTVTSNLITGIKSAIEQRSKGIRIISISMATDFIQLLDADCDAQLPVLEDDSRKLSEAILKTTKLVEDTQNKNSAQLNENKEYLEFLIKLKTKTEETRDAIDYNLLNFREFSKAISESEKVGLTIVSGAPNRCYFGDDNCNPFKLDVLKNPEFRADFLIKFAEDPKKIYDDWLVAKANPRFSGQLQATLEKEFEEFIDEVVTYVKPGISPPACFDKVVVVSSVENNFQLAKFASPGLSLRNRGVIALGRVNVVDAAGDTWIASGNSLATPAVSGVLALMLEAKPDSTPSELRSALFASADYEKLLASNKNFKNFVGEESLCEHLGHGLVNAEKAVKFLLKKEASLSESEKYCKTSTKHDDGAVSSKVPSWLETIAS